MTLPAPYYERDGATIHVGDCLVVMAAMEPESVDSVVCDPPYGLSFMGKDWDHGVPGEAFWREALRVAKPGAWMLAFGGTRTHHRLACAIEDAGWEIRDTIGWLYGSGFPKSHDVSKAIDKAAGAERKVVSTRKLTGKARVLAHGGNNYGGEYGRQPMRETYDETLPATDAARQWSGWGTALKPAWEPVIVARKPLIGTVAENVLKYGTGGINVDGCRVGLSADEDVNKLNARSGGKRGFSSQYVGGDNDGNLPSGCDLSKGRWPANIIHDGSEEVLAVFPYSESQHGTVTSKPGSVYGNGAGLPSYTGAYGFNDSGSAARFFYTAKASKADRDAGCEGMAPRVAGGMSGRADGSMGSVTHSRNHHPTVKPTDLMRYLVRLVTPPGGIVLDPFMGSGSTGRGAILEGMRFIGIELSEAYCAIAARRCEEAFDAQGLYRQE